LPNTVFLVVLRTVKTSVPILPLRNRTLRRSHTFAAGDDNSQ
jgi:hypothetical protein